MKMESVALIPAFNEEETIEEVISRLKKIGLKSIVIDDGSTDKTNDLAKKSDAIVIKHTMNMGKGEALKTGFNYVLKNMPEIKYVSIIDADMQYLPEEAVRILKPLQDKKADFVMGCRNWSTVPLRHNFGNFVWRGIFNLLFKTKFKDTNCGFIGLSRKAIEKIQKIHGGYIIENMMLVEALRCKLRIKQIPVSVNYKYRRNVFSGLRMGLGVLVFIIEEGIKYRLSKI
jgi:glycosyltransferase involved in cell wall biosynthesis